MKLDKLLACAKAYIMSPEESEAQRRSFAYGNANIENRSVTREEIASAAEKIPSPYNRNKLL